MSALSGIASVTSCHDVESGLEKLKADADVIGLFDTRTLADTSSGARASLLNLRGSRAMGMVTSDELDSYLSQVRAWGLTHAIVKEPPLREWELRAFLDMVREPASGFGLLNFMGSTVEMYNVAIRTGDAKRQAIDRVVNHFATCGFEIHDLYEVRLILEEVCNNALFHAFRSATGEEKYSVKTFRNLDEGESVRLEFGSDGHRTGFSVTDSAGTLPVDTILTKLERQMSQEAIFDESGRGLHLSRLLSSLLVINIEHGKRTQFIALFDDTRRHSRPKPFLLNYVGPDSFESWGSDPDLDF